MAKDITENIGGMRWGVGAHSREVMLSRSKNERFRETG